MALTAKNLSISLASTPSPKPLVDDITFTLEAGQVLGIVGPSGSGKSLTGLAVSGLLPPAMQATGSVSVQHLPLNLLEASPQQWRHVRGRHLAYVGQNALGCLHPAYRVRTQLAEAVSAHQSFRHRFQTSQQRAEIGP